VAESLLLAEVRASIRTGWCGSRITEPVAAGVMKLEAPIVAEMDSEAVALLTQQHFASRGQRA